MHYWWTVLATRCNPILMHAAGAANAGVPLAHIVEKYGWNAYFSALGASCIIVVLLILPCVNLKSYSQRIEEENAKTA